MGSEYVQKLLVIDNLHDIKYVYLTSENELTVIESEIFNLIKTKFETRIIKSIVKEQYSYFTKNEQMFIVGESKKLISNTDVYSMVISKIHDYLKEESNLNIEGFINFRLREYISVIGENVEKAVNEYINECEYNYIIKALTMHVEFQEALVESVEIICYEDCYVVNDSDGKNIIIIYLFDDVLLDVLLTLAPNSIVIKNHELFINKELLKTLCNVFNNRVSLGLNS